MVSVWRNWSSDTLKHDYRGVSRGYVEIQMILPRECPLMTICKKNLPFV